MLNLLKQVMTVFICYFCPASYSTMLVFGWYCFDVIFINCFCLQRALLCLWWLFSPLCVSASPQVIRSAEVIGGWMPHNEDNTSTLIKIQLVTVSLRESEHLINATTLSERYPMFEIKTTKEWRGVSRIQKRCIWWGGLVSEEVI